MRIALGRVLYPYMLLNEHRQTYIDYLKAHKDNVFEWFLNHHDTQSLEKSAGFLLDKETSDRWILLARDAKETEFVSFLMDYKMKHFTPDEDYFEL